MAISNKLEKLKTNIDELKKCPLFAYDPSKSLNENIKTLNNTKVSSIKSENFTYVKDIPQIPACAENEGYCVLYVTETYNTFKFRYTTIDGSKVNLMYGLNANAYNYTGIYTSDQTITFSTDFYDKFIIIKIVGKLSDIVFTDSRIISHGSNFGTTTTSFGMFNGCKYLTNITELNTKNVTDMTKMFYKCSALQTIPLFNTNKVTDMSYMFSFSALQTIPQLDTSNVTNMKYMFDTCFALQTIPLLDTSKVTDMSYMFSYCKALQTIPLLDTSKVIYMPSMFTNCISLQTAPKLDTSNVTNMISMFSNCSSLRSVSLNINGTGTNMFSGCSSLIDKDKYHPNILDEFLPLPTPNDNELYLLTYITPNGGTVILNFTFTGTCTLSIPEINFTDNMTNNTDYRLNRNYTEFSNVLTSDKKQFIIKITGNITKINTIKYLIMDFRGNLPNCTKIDNLKDSTLFKFSLSKHNITDMNHMFAGCTSLQTIPQLDTSNVTNMSYMFNGCYSLQTIPQLDTSNVTNMSYMFTSCPSLKTIPLLDTSKVINMSNMFNGCYSLQTIPQLDTSNVTDMSGMFTNCNILQFIPLFNTSKVTNISNMFYNCNALQTILQLDTSGITNTTAVYDICNDCYSLRAKVRFTKDINISYTNTIFE